MIAILVSLFTGVGDLFRRRSDREAELRALRHQVLVLRRQHGKRRVPLRLADRVYWVVLSRLWPRWRDALVVVTPETVIAWHRRGFRWYWRWRSRPRRVGRPGIRRDVIALITCRFRKSHPGYLRSEHFDLQRCPGTEDGDNALYHGNHNGSHERSLIEAVCGTQCRLIIPADRSRLWLQFHDDRVFGTHSPEFRRDENSNRFCGLQCHPSRRVSASRRAGKFGT